jgi:spermidine synthase
VGLVGLGAGSLFAYAEPGQHWTIFEIDPVVQRIAEDGRYFSFVSEARKRGVEIEVILGDARLTLGSARKSFDLLVIDAFTSGAIPVHLLTREAFGLYEERLAPDGVLALHISNRHLDLAPLVRAMARDRGRIAVVEDAPAGGKQQIGSRWAFLSRSAESLRARGFPPNGADGSPGLGRLWTDDRSDLWSLFLW